MPPTTDQLYTIFFLISFTCNHLIDNAQANDLGYDIQNCYRMNKIKYNRENINSRKLSTKMGIIQSPNYPSKYFKYIDCVFLIHAPQGHVIRIKSFERFDIEPSSDCEHDYLELRDGLFGYSPLIGRYCNSKSLVLPIESRNSDMWIRFKTDESIELHGFRIVYEFKKVPLNYQPNNLGQKSTYDLLNCEIFHKYTNIDRLTSMTISSRELEAYYYAKLNDLIANHDNVSNMFDVEFLRNNLDCTIHIQVHPNERISILFESVNVTTRKTKTQSKQKDVIIPTTVDCTNNFLQVYDASTSEVNRRINYCSIQSNQFFKSTSNRIFIRYSVKKNQKRILSYFRLTYNPFSRAGECSSDSYRCKDGSCIDPKLLCDGKRNCNSSSDENSCRSILSSNQNSPKQPIWTDNVKLAYLHKISIMSIGVLLLCLIVVSLAISCRRSIKQHLRNVKEFEKIYMQNQMNEGCSSNLNDINLSDGEDNGGRYIRRETKWIV